MNYGEHIKFCFRSLKDNKKLVLPSVYSALIQLPFLILAIYLSGVWDVVYSFIQTRDPTVILYFFQNNLARFLITWIAFFIVSYVIGTGFEAIRYNMIKAVMEKETVKIKFASKNRFFNLVFVKLVFDVIKWIILGVMIYLSLPFFRAVLNNTPEEGIVSLVSAVLIGFLLFIIYGIVSFFAMFRFASLFLDNTNFSHAIKNSFSLVKNNFWFAVVIVLLLFAGRIITGIATQALELILRILLLPLTLLAASPSLAIVGYIWIGLWGLLLFAIIYLVGVAYIVLSDLFLFSTYKFTKKAQGNQKRK